ncbi:MAG: bacteriohemerythrin, partial [Leptospiraceae bacterium]|nr:bacteriohemerythrin [Leptospiraceae bacterium]
MNYNENNDYFIVFPWNKNLETGEEMVDKQHKELVELLNKLANTLISNKKPEIEFALSNLAEYAKIHFQYEEEIWRNYFPEDSWYQNHKNTHENFLPKIIEIQALNKDKPIELVAEGILKFLIRWLAFHIIDSDKRMMIAVDFIKLGNNIEEAKIKANEIMSGSMSLLVETILHMYDGLSSRTLMLMRERNARIKVEKENEELIHILCHDLVNPLGQVESILEISTEEPEFFLEVKDNLHLSVKNGLNLINEVRKLHSKEGKNINLEKVHLCEALNESITLLRNKWEQKNIKINNSCNENIFVKAEKTLLINSVFNNILNNAVKFSNE